MMKTRIEKIVAIGGGSLLLFGFLMCCSGIQFPFPYAKGWLNHHLNEDFGTILPGSAVVEESHWVALRDPENVFKVQIAPSEIAPFVEHLRTTAKTRNFTEQSERNVSRFGPLYRTPLWWNNPPLANALTLEFMIPDRTGLNPGAPILHYRFLYSPSTGKLYVVWGGF